MRFTRTYSVVSCQLQLAIEAYRTVYRYLRPHLGSGFGRLVVGIDNLGLSAHVCTLCVCACSYSGWEVNMSWRCVFCQVCVIDGLCRVQGGEYLRFEDGIIRVALV